MVFSRVRVAVRPSHTFWDLTILRVAEAKNGVAGAVLLGCLAI
jgi:hypothetical protein